MKTREEVEGLKRQWLADPCWDVASTEGFEDYQQELGHFQAEQEAKWEAERPQRARRALADMPAFPDDHKQIGMTYRQWLVGQALNGLLSSGAHRLAPETSSPFCNGPAVFADAAIAMADATLDHLSKE